MDHIHDKIMACITFRRIDEWAWPLVIELGHHQREQWADMGNANENK